MRLAILALRATHVNKLAICLARPSQALICNLRVASLKPDGLLPLFFVGSSLRFFPIFHPGLSPFLGTAGAVGSQVGADLARCGFSVSMSPLMTLKTRLRCVAARSARTGFTRTGKTVFGVAPSAGLRAFGKFLRGAKSRIKSGAKAPHFKIWRSVLGLDGIGRPRPPGWSAVNRPRH